MRSVIQQTLMGTPALGSAARAGTCTASYRFTFNGQEKDDEVYGSTGTSMTAEFWQYDTRTGRRWNMDPVDKPWLAPYHGFGNKPTTNVDPNGARNDDYRLSKDGTLSLINKTSASTHTIYNENGSQSFEVDKTLIDKSVNFSSGNIKSSLYTSLNNEGRMEQAFRFLSNNTNVEWQLETVKNMKSSTAISVLTTSHQVNTVNDLSNMTHRLLTNNPSLSLSYAVHSHPPEYNPKTGYPAYPSGFDSNGSPRLDFDDPEADKGDRARYWQYKKNIGENRIAPEFEIYLPSRPSMTILYNDKEMTKFDILREPIEPKIK
jgi:hypothetical protein